MNISENTIIAIQTLVNSAFNTNSILDRAKSVLNAKLDCPNIGKLVHELAHKYSLDIADTIGDLIENYDIVVDYGNIPTHVEDYKSVREVLDRVLEVTIDFENALNMATKIAFDNMDLHIYNGLLEVIEEHTKYVQQALLWSGIAKKYGDNPSLDVHIGTHYDILSEGD